MFQEYFAKQFVFFYRNTLTMHVLDIRRTFSCEFKFYIFTPENLCKSSPKTQNNSLQNIDYHILMIFPAYCTMNVKHIKFCLHLFMNYALFANSFWQKRGAHVNPWTAVTKKPCDFAVRDASAENRSYHFFWKKNMLTV